MNNETGAARIDNPTDTCKPKKRDGIVDENVTKCGATASTAMTAPASITTAATTKELRLENLGRKARERLQNERSKRRVIQRIGFDNDTTEATDGDESVAIAPRQSTRNPQKSVERQDSNCNENSLLVEAAVLARKRKATTVKARATKTTSGIINQRPKRQLRNRPEDDDHHARVMIDPWIPDISHIHATSETATGCVVSSSSSNTVQLHGLPIHTTVPQIRSFFTGLQIQRILLLLPYPTEKLNMKETFRILDLDAQNDDRPMDHPRRMERYDANRVRLWVQFPSDTIATCAHLRSGEAIFSTTKSPTGDDDHQPLQPEKGESQQIGATVAITIVPQAMANRMTKLLGIDLMDNSTRNTNSTTLEQIIAPIIERIDPQIAMTLWAAAIDEFSFRVHGLISSPPNNNNQTHRFCLLRIAATDAELQELQNQRLSWQQEIDRIVQVSSSSSSSLSMKRPENAHANTNHWHRVLLFLLSTTDSTTTINHYSHHGRGGPTKLTGLLQTAVMPQDDPILPLTKEYLELLQLYIRRIETTITMTQRQRLLRSDGP